MDTKHESADGIFWWPAELPSGRCAYIVGYSDSIKTLTRTSVLPPPPFLILMSTEDYVACGTDVSMRLVCLTNRAEYTAASVSRRFVVFHGSERPWIAPIFAEFYRLYAYALTRLCPCHHAGWRALFVKSRYQGLAYHTRARAIPAALLRQETRKGAFAFQLVLGRGTKQCEIEVHRVRTFAIEPPGSPPPQESVAESHVRLLRRPVPADTPVYGHRLPSVSGRADGEGLLPEPGSLVYEDEAAAAEGSDLEADDGGARCALAPAPLLLQQQPFPRLIYPISQEFMPQYGSDGVWYPPQQRPVIDLSRSGVTTYYQPRQV